MALMINTESLKKISNMIIECKLVEQLGVQVFNNLGTTTPEYMELCNALKNSLEKVNIEIELLKLDVPTI
jgi:hypothetical protein